jgi:hypothetical protein
LQIKSANCGRAKHHGENIILTKQVKDWIEMYLKLIAGHTLLKTDSKQTLFFPMQEAQEKMMFCILKTFMKVHSWSDWTIVFL